MMKNKDKPPPILKLFLLTITGWKNQRELYSLTHVLEKPDTSCAIGMRSWKNQTHFEQCSFWKNQTELYSHTHVLEKPDTTCAMGMTSC